MRGGILLRSLDRYILRQLAFALLAVTGGLTALIWLTQSLRFVELVVNHGLSLGVFLRLTGLLIPSFIAVILPITTFIVTQFVYQRLAGDRELTVMRAAGVSTMALSRPALILALGVVATVYAFNLWLVPLSLSAFRDYQWEIRNRMAAFLLQEGVFSQVSDTLTVYVRSRDPNGIMHGILINDARDKESPVTIFAESGRLLNGGKGLNAVLMNGTREVIDRQTGRLDILTFRENTVALSDATKEDAPRILDMSEASLSTLLRPPSYLSPPQQQRWIAEAHKRLATPVTAISYSLIALLSVLTGAFRRQGSFVRPLAAIGAVVGLLALELASDNLAARNNALLPMIWLQATVPTIICAWALLGPQLLSGIRQSALLRAQPAE
jgi:lipopolysaccharide export system permease protein